jgi:heme/copper-type cytochrome/quinol oxidase subunit 2
MSINQPSIFSVTFGLILLLVILTVFVIFLAFAFFRKSRENKQLYEQILATNKGL